MAKDKSPFSVRSTILQALIEGPSYGYEISKRVKERTNGEVIIREGSLYPALAALLADGLLTTYETEPLSERGGRPRKYYELNAEGLRAARDERALARRLYGLMPKESSA